MAMQDDQVMVTVIYHQQAMVLSKRESGKPSTYTYYNSSIFTHCSGGCVTTPTILLS